MNVAGVERYDRLKIPKRISVEVLWDRFLYWYSQCSCIRLLVCNLKGIMQWLDKHMNSMSWAINASAYWADNLKLKLKLFLLRSSILVVVSWSCCCSSGFVLVQTIEWL